MLIFGLPFLIYSWLFKKLIKANSFNGMDSASAKRFIMAQPFTKRVLMSYIGRCNPTGKQRSGLATWVLVCHYISTLSYITIIIMSWSEVISIEFFDIELNANDYIIGSITYNGLITLVMLTTVAILPLSVVISIPFTFCSKIESEDLTESLSTSWWERVLDRIFELAFPKK